MHFSAGADGETPPHFRGKKRLRSGARVRGVMGLLLRQCQEIPGELRCYPTTPQ